VAPFKYQQVDQQLINELYEKLINSQSVILLGPRYGGKRYVMDRLRIRLKDAGIEPIVQLRLLSETPICTVAAIGDLIRQAVQAADQTGLRDYALGEDPFDPLRTLISENRKPVVLLVANVDGISHHLARKFLQEVRTLVETHQLVAVMSGESDFRELVHGENSDFSTCAEHYVLQGYAFEAFADFLTSHLGYLRLEFLEAAKAYEHLWETTGGNLYILRILLWSIIQQRAKSNIPPGTRVTIDEIPGAVKLIGIPGAYGAHIFRHATQLIARDALCWKELQELMAGRLVRVQPYDAPGHLELAGIAIRRIFKGEAKLRFSSRVMKAFIEQFYDSRRFGDLYASVGEWKEAFARYSQLAPEERVRPSSTDDRAEVEATIGAFCSSLYAEVARQERSDTGALPDEVVKTHFANGCHYILGFREVTFWQRDTLTPTPEWRIHGSALFEATTEKNCIEQLLPAPSERNLKPGVIQPKDSSSKYAVVAILPSRLNTQLIVVVSDFAGTGVVSQERRRFIEQVLKHFIGAYRHAVAVIDLQDQHRIRRKHDSIVDSVFEDLTRAEFDKQTLLRKAARGLRQLEYKRVLFCIVNKERKAIVGAVDDSDDSSVDVAALTNWPLSKPTADLQPYVIHTKQPRIVQDARDEPLASKKVVRAAGMEALAIVPVLNSVGEAIGTIHVERMDGSAPTRTEVDDLVFFGRQLAIAIEQLERLEIEKGALLEKSFVASLPGRATSTDQAIVKMLEAMALLGHKWGRLYLIEYLENGDWFFVSRRWHGITTPHETDAEADFNQGKVVLAPRSSGHPDWDCIEKAEPILYCWNQGLADGEVFITAGGLKVINWKDPSQPKQIRKRPGDFWMDFPLIDEKRPLGKICLHLDESFGKRHFELLKNLATHFSAILAANIKRDQDKETQEQMIMMSTADQTIATMAHNLGTRIGSLPVILDLYRDGVQKRDYRELEQLNEKLEKIIESAQTAVKRFKLVSVIKPRLRRVDINTFIVDILVQNLPENAWKFCGPAQHPIVDVDPNLFETAFLELVQNSRDVASSLDALRLSVTLEVIDAEEEKAVTITYRDNGPGVPDEYREMIFEDFFSYRPNQKLPGTGIGMAFARRVIRAHGGTIFYSGQINPSDPPGAQFTLTLPWTGKLKINEETQDVQNIDSRGSTRNIRLVKENNNKSDR
jgi:nitrogen-specific signal transduction histidine kinase